MAIDNKILKKEQASIAKSTSIASDISGIPIEGIADNIVNSSFGLIEGIQGITGKILESKQKELETTPTPNTALDNALAIAGAVQGKGGALGAFQALKQVQANNERARQFQYNMEQAQLQLQQETEQHKLRDIEISNAKLKAREQIGAQLGKTVFDLMREQNDYALTYGISNNDRPVDRSNFAGIKDTWYQYAQGIKDAVGPGLISDLVDGAVGDPQTQRDKLNSQRLGMEAQEVLSDTMGGGFFDKAGRFLDAAVDETVVSLAGSVPELAPFIFGGGAGAVTRLLGGTAAKGIGLGVTSSLAVPETFRKAAELAGDTPEGLEARRATGFSGLKEGDVLRALPEAAGYTALNAIDAMLAAKAVTPIASAFRPIAAGVGEEVASHTARRQVLRNALANTGSALKEVSKAGALEFTAEGLQTGLEENVKHKNLLTDVLGGKKSFGQYISETYNEHSGKMWEAAKTGFIVGAGLVGPANTGRAIINTAKDRIVDNNARRGLESVTAHMQDGILSPEYRNSAQYIDDLAAISRSRNVGVDNESLRNDMNSDLEFINQVANGDYSGVIDSNGNISNPDRMTLLNNIYNEESPRANLAELYKAFDQETPEEVKQSQEYQSTLGELNSITLNTDLDIAMEKALDKLENGNVVEKLAVRDYLSKNLADENNTIARALEGNTDIANEIKDLQAIIDDESTPKDTIEKLEAQEALKALQDKYNALLKNVNSAASFVNNNFRGNTKRLLSTTIQPLGQLKKLVKEIREQENPIDSKQKAYIYKRIGKGHSLQELQDSYQVSQAVDNLVSETNTPAQDVLASDTISVGGETIGTGVLNNDTSDTILKSFDSTHTERELTNHGKTTASVATGFDRINDATTNETVKNTIRKELKELGQGILGKINDIHNRGTRSGKSQVEIENEINTVLSEYGLPTFIDKLLNTPKDQQAEMIKYLMDFLGGPQTQSILNALDINLNPSNRTTNDNTVKKSKSEPTDTASVDVTSDRMERLLSLLADYMKKNNAAEARLLQMSAGMRKLRKSEFIDYAVVQAEIRADLTKIMNKLYHIVAHREAYSDETYNKKVIALQKDLARILSGIQMKINVHNKVKQNVQESLKGDINAIPEADRKHKARFYTWNIDTGEFEFIDQPTDVSEMHKFNERTHITRMAMNYVSFDPESKLVTNEADTSVANQSFTEILEETKQTVETVYSQIKELSNEAVKKLNELSIAPDTTKASQITSGKEFRKQLKEHLQEIKKLETEIKEIEESFAETHQISIADNKRLVDAKNNLVEAKRNYDALRLAIDTGNTKLTEKQVKEIQQLLDLNKSISKAMLDLKRVTALMKNKDSNIVRLAQAGLILIRSLVKVYKQLLAIPFNIREEFSLSDLFSHLKKMGINSKSSHSVANANLNDLIESFGKWQDKKSKAVNKSSKSIQGFIKTFLSKNKLNEGLATRLDKAVQNVNFDEISKDYHTHNAEFNKLYKEFLQSPEEKARTLLGTTEIIGIEDNVNNLLAVELTTLEGIPHFKEIRKQFETLMSENKVDLTYNPSDILFRDMFDITNNANDGQAGQFQQTGKLKKFYQEALFYAYLHAKAQINVKSDVKVDKDNTSTIFDTSTTPPSSFDNLLATSFLTILNLRFRDNIALTDREALQSALGKMFVQDFKLDTISITNERVSRRDEAFAIAAIDHALTNPEVGVFKDVRAFRTSVKEAKKDSKYNAKNKVLKQHVTRDTQAVMDRFIEQGFNGASESFELIALDFDELATTDTHLVQIFQLVKDTFVGKVVPEANSKEQIQLVKTKAIEALEFRMKLVFGETLGTKLVNQFYEQFGLKAFQEADPVPTPDKNANHQLEYEQYTQSDRVADEINKYIDIYEMYKAAETTTDGTIYPVISIQELGRIQSEGVIGNIQSNKPLRAMISYWEDSNLAERALKLLQEKLKNNSELTKLTMFAALDLVSPGRISVAERKAFLAKDETTEMWNFYTKLLKEVKDPNNTLTALQAARQFVSEFKLNTGPTQGMINYGSVITVFQHAKIDANGNVTLDLKHINMETDGSSFGFTTISALLGMTQAQLEAGARGRLTAIKIGFMSTLDNYTMTGYTYIIDAFNTGSKDVEGKDIVGQSKLDEVAKADMSYRDLYTFMTHQLDVKYKNSPFLHKLLKIQLGLLFGANASSTDPLTYNASGTTTYADLILLNLKKPMRQLGKSPLTLSVYGSGILTNAGKLGLAQLNDTLRAILQDSIDETTALGKLFTSDYSTFLSGLMDNIDNPTAFAENLSNPESEFVKGLTNKNTKPDETHVGELHTQLFLMKEVLGITDLASLKKFQDPSTAQERTEAAINKLGTELAPLVEGVLERQSGYNSAYLDVMKKVHTFKNLMLLRKLVKNILDITSPLANKKDIDVDSIIKIDGEHFTFDASRFTSLEIETAYRNVLAELSKDKNLARAFGIRSEEDVSMLHSMFNHMVVQIKQKAFEEKSKEQLDTQSTVYTGSNVDNITSSVNQNTSDKIIMVEYGSTFAPSIGQSIDSRMMQLVMEALPPEYRFNQVFDAFISPVAYMSEVAKAANASLGNLIYDLDMNPFYQTIKGVAESLSQMLAYDSKLKEIFNSSYSVENLQASLASLAQYMEVAKYATIQHVQGALDINAFDTGLSLTEEAPDGIKLDSAKHRLVPTSRQADATAFYALGQPNVDAINELIYKLGGNAFEVLHDNTNFNTFIERVNTLLEGLKAVSTLPKEYVTTLTNIQTAFTTAGEIKYVENGEQSGQTSTFIQRLSVLVGANNANMDAIRMLNSLLSRDNTIILNENADASRATPFNEHMSFGAIAKRQVRAIFNSTAFKAFNLNNTNLENLLRNSIADNLAMNRHQTVQTTESGEVNALYNEFVQGNGHSITGSLGQLRSDLNQTRGESVVKFSDLIDTHIFNNILSLRQTEPIEDIEVAYKMLQDYKAEEAFGIDEKALKELLQDDYYQDVILRLAEHYHTNNTKASEQTKGEKDKEEDKTFPAFSDEVFVRFTSLLAEIADNSKSDNAVTNFLTSTGISLMKAYKAKLQTLGYPEGRFEGNVALTNLVKEIATELDNKTIFGPTVAKVIVVSNQNIHNPDLKLSTIDTTDYNIDRAVDDYIKATTSHSELGTVNMEQDVTSPLKKMTNATPEQLESLLDELIINTNEAPNYRQSSTAWLKDRLKEFISRFTREVNVEINMGANANTQGVYSADTHTVTLHLTNRTRNRMSPAEIYLHELTHAFLDYAEDSKDPLVRKYYREIQRIQKEFISYARENVSEIAQALGVSEETALNDYINYMANSTKEFGAILNSNEALQSILSNMNTKQSKWELFKKLFVGLLDIVFRTNMYIRSANEAANFDSLIRKIGSANANLSQSWENNAIERTLIKAAGVLNKGANKALAPIKQNYHQGADNLLDKALKPSASKVLKYFTLAWAYPSAISGYGETNLKLIRLARELKGDASNTEIFFSSMVDTDSGKTDLYNPYIGKSNNIDKMRNSVEAAVKAEMKQAFKITPSIQEQQALTKVIKATDVTVLSGDNDYIIDSILTGNKGEFVTGYNQEASKLKSLVKEQETFEFMERAIENLAEHMVTGKVQGFILSNAVNIALRLTPTQEAFNRREIEYDVAAAATIIDRMITYKALQKTPDELFNNVSSLSSYEREGVKTILQKSREVSESSKKQFLDITQVGGKAVYGVSNYQKGYVKRPGDKSVAIRIGRASDEAKMRKLGYKLVDKYHALERGASYSDVAIYVSHTEYPQGYNRGIMRLTGENSRGWNIGSFIKQSHPDVDEKTLEALTFSETKAIALALQSNKAIGWKNAKFIPVFDSKGRIKDFNIALDNATKESIGLEEVSIFDAVANEVSRVIDQEMSYHHNIEFIDLQENYYTTHKNNPNLKFITISPNAESNSNLPQEEIDSIWSMLHPRVQQYILDRHNGKIHIRSDVLLDVTGYKDKRLIKDDQEGTKISNPVLRRILRGMEGITLKSSKMNKERIVLKTPDIVLGNLKSNVYMAVATYEVPLTVLTNKLLRNIEIMEEYKADKETIANLRAKEILAANTKVTAEINKRIEKIEKKWEGTSFQALDNYGLMTDIVEDTSFESEEATDDFYDKKAQKLITKLPPILQLGINNAMISQKTTLWKALNNIVGLSDSLFRLAVYEYKVENGMKPEEALRLVERAFVNYSYHDSPYVKWLNDVGFVRFTKYLFRTQKTIAQDMLGDKPVTTAVAIAAKSVLKAVVETPFNSFLPTKIERYSNMIYLPLWSAFNDYFGGDMIHIDNFIPGIDKI